MYTRRKEGASGSTEFASVHEFVSKCGGKKVIEKVLIANNGIAAVKEKLIIKLIINFIKIRYMEIYELIKSVFVLLEAGVMKVFEMSARSDLL